MGFVELIY